MSYLLTEIALEMLGYKFYDIEGNLGVTNFQSNSELNCSNTGACNKEARPLETILNLIRPSGRCEAEQGGVNFCINKKLNEAESLVKRAQQRNYQKKPLNPLKRILDRECRQIRAQIIRNKEALKQSKTEVDKAGHVDSVVEDNFAETEKLNLQMELQTLRVFRKRIERNLFKINAENFERYKRIFLH